MQLRLTYDEIRDYDFGIPHVKKLTPAYIDNTTVSITAEVDFFISLSYKFRSKVEQIIGTDLHLTCDDGLLKIVGMIPSFKEQLQKKADYIEIDGHSIVVRLSKIKQLDKVLEKVKPENVSFDTSGIIIDMKLK